MTTGQTWRVVIAGDGTSAGTARTGAGIPVSFAIAPPLAGPSSSDLAGLGLHLECARLKLLRGFEDLLCLDGLHGVEQLPHQIETVRKVLRHFRGRVLLADEVGLGKTIEACLLLREYLLRGMVRRVLILVPAPLVPQWRDELLSKFGLEFDVARKETVSTAAWWSQRDRVLASISLAKSRKHFDAVAACPWDVVIVDEAHHCKNRTSRNWQLVNALQRRHLFLLTATPVQNDMVELYNLLTLLEPGHLKTEKHFKKTYVRRGNPRDPRNRQQLRSLLGEVMVRNTRSLVSIDLPPRYAQTFVVSPGADEAELYGALDSYLRPRAASLEQSEAVEPDSAEDIAEEHAEYAGENVDNLPAPAHCAASPSDLAPAHRPLSRMQLNALLVAAGSHPAALARSLERRAGADAAAAPLLELARRVARSAKDEKLLELLRQNPDGKVLVFAGLRATLERLQNLLVEARIPFTLFSGEQTVREKESAIAQFRNDVPVMLCSESGGEGHNLQFANTLINFDLPWNPMRIEQRVGRVHRIGQTREVFIFNLCTAGSIEERILRLMNEKIRMFELVVGEVGSILGNLEGGEEFESLVLNLWLRSRDGAALDAAFAQLGDSLLDAHEEYVRAKVLDDALFGADYE